jgi:hypothetical protein
MPLSLAVAISTWVMRPPELGLPRIGGHRKGNCRDNADGEFLRHAENRTRPPARISPIATPRGAICSRISKAITIVDGSIRYRLHHPRAGRGEIRVTRCPLFRSKSNSARCAHQTPSCWLKAQHAVSTKSGEDQAIASACAKTHRKTYAKKVARGVPRQTNSQTEVK